MMSDDGHKNLELPLRMSIDDPGAHGLDSSDSDEHFSDAQSGLEHSGAASPVVPTTRVEKVDSEGRHGEVPGTLASRMRKNDAEPDGVAVVPDTTGEVDSGANKGRLIPTNMVEKVEPSSPAHGEISGILAHDQRTTDAAPNMVVELDHSSPQFNQHSRVASTPGNLPIPITKIKKINSAPSHGEVPGTKAFEMRKEDAEPDIVEEVGDSPVSPTFHGARSSAISHSRGSLSGAGEIMTKDGFDEQEDGFIGGGVGDDFDDFEDGEDAEFGEFDDGFHRAESVHPLQFTHSSTAFPVLNYAELDSTEDIETAAQPYINTLFPLDFIDKSILPPVAAENPSFLTQRSASLWSQLIAPPPLQPPNWIRSRIRRLFLVSLGVPVDLDEILPASKQKKLILPSIHLNPSSGSPRTSTDSRSISRLKQSDGNTSTTSLDSQGKPSRSESRRRKGPAPTPQLDLVSARQLCTITDEAMNGLAMVELQEHVRKLEIMQGFAQEVLDYWTKRTDEKIGDREAFEGVIENLVKHARKVRK